MNTGENNNQATQVNNDEEAPAFPPREISFNRHHHMSTRPFNEDDDTIPSELSTLIAPSTLTPNGYGSPLPTSHPSGERSSMTEGSTIFYSRKAFQLAALLGFVSIGGLFGGDLVYMMVTSSNNNEVRSHNNMSSSINMDALDYRNGVVRGSKSRDYDEGEAGAHVPVQTEKVSKKTKAAKKNKARKKHKEERMERETDAEEMSEDEEEEDDDEEEDGSSEDDEEEENYDQSGHNDLIMRDNDDDVGPIITHITDHQDIVIPQAQERCLHVVQTFEEQNADITNYDFLRDKYAHQSTDPNVFYRATALLFWKDFGEGIWGSDQDASIDFGELIQLEDARYEDGTLLSPMSTWTWITGDQHLSNFGAWRNRGGEVVFSVNDFDEAAIYDFHIDVLRIAVSICSHGFTNGLSEEQIREALQAFTYTYVKTAIDYVGGDSALVYELTPDTSTGVLRDYLWDVEENRSTSRQLHKFTEVDSDGVRRFIRNDETRLEDVEPDVEEKIRAEITSTRYGASMMKMGWKVRGWDDDFFTVLDIARRVGSGVGSYGVDRFYVLLKGEDPLLEDGLDGPSVILDVKYEPKSAVSTIFEGDDPEIRAWQAWYKTMFRNEADRAGQAQKRLTSYTDPYVGYLVIDGNSYNVRQRSPYKSSFDLDTLKYPRAFTEFMEQIAVATATAHVRGTVAKSPGQFKHVIKLLLAGDRNRRRWSELVANIALSYRQQVLLDFSCFKDYVKKHFSPNYDG